MGTNVRPSIVTNGLVLYLDAGSRQSYVSGSTTWRDLSGNNSTATLNSGITFETNNLGRLAFNGTTGLASLPAAVIPASSDWTYSAAVLFNALGSRQNLFSQFTSTGADRTVIRLRSDSTPANCFSIFTATTSFIDSPTPVSANRIYNLTLTRSSNTLTFYINGRFDSAFTPSAFTIQQTTPVIGARSTTTDPLGTPTDFLNGKLYTTMIHNRALSATEVAQNYNALKNRYNLP